MTAVRPTAPAGAPAPPMREQFTEIVGAALDVDPRLAVVLADISADRFAAAASRHPHRVLNVGIREQALIGVAGGLALTGMRPVVHSIAPFLVERPFEQLKLDLNHQGVGAVLVSTGASYDYPAAGRTHMAPGDVALLDALPGWAVHVPGHPAEFAELLRGELLADGLAYLRMSERTNEFPLPAGRGFQVVRRGSAGVVLAVGPMLRPVLAATGSLDVTVLYASTVRPFDGAALRSAALAAVPDVVLVEPCLRDTSTAAVSGALTDLPHRVLGLGVARDAELRAYGTAAEHDAAHGLDAAGLAGAIRRFLVLDGR
ncbi:transketolase family protein [Saccharopolyspora sp. MS10]|uniref:transketolase family protein n=1 Tax=Saccharopolyspora sp. MS10 TaxID=3385973 RepID=UPI0039A2CEFB